LYRNYIGIRKNTTSSDIAKVTITKNRGVSIRTKVYPSDVKSKKFAFFSYDSLNAALLPQYCDEKNIPFKTEDTVNKHLPL